jgi:hypothetical protein
MPLFLMHRLSPPIIGVFVIVLMTDKHVRGGSGFV